MTATVTRSRLADAPMFTGWTLRPEGFLAIYSEGNGLVVGPLSPSELRSLGTHALILAAEIEARHQDIADGAAMALARIVALGNA
jgi:hypothetical protein